MSASLLLHAKILQPLECSDFRFNGKTGKYWWKIFTRYECVWKHASLGFPDALKNSSKAQAPAKLESQRHKNMSNITIRSPLPELAISLFLYNGVFTSRVILRYAFDAKITVSRSLLCLFRRILYRRQFRKWIGFLTAWFSLSADEEGVRGSSYCRFSSELLLSAYKNLNYWLKYC